MWSVPPQASGVSLLGECPEAGDQTMRRSPTLSRSNPIERLVPPWLASGSARAPQVRPTPREHLRLVDPGDRRREGVRLLRQRWRLHARHERDGGGGTPGSTRPRLGLGWDPTASLRHVHTLFIVKDNDHQSFVVGLNAAAGAGCSRVDRGEGTYGQPRSSGGGDPRHRTAITARSDLVRGRQTRPRRSGG